MGNEAVELDNQDDSDLDKEAVEDERETQEAGGMAEGDPSEAHDDEEPKEGDQKSKAEDGEEDEEEEVEIVQKGEATLPQDKVNRAFSRRVQRLNEKRREAEGKAQESQSELELEREKTKLLMMRLEQLSGEKGGSGQEGGVKKPNPDDFDAGYYDPEYIEAKEKWDEYRLDQMFQKKMDAVTQTQTKSKAQQEQREALEAKQFAHYERASKLKVKNYEDVEDKALEVMGQEFVNDIIATFDEDSEKLLYYWGKNPGHARKIVELVKANPAKGLAEIGALRSNLEVRRKTKNLPDPDDELERGRTGSKRDKIDGPEGAKFW